ncbi:MAG TPA: redox-regulated ATPase YchF [Candidatus Pacearchaeota archaeon]|nr:redox-regulated ATPase YchF [Candidatus Pacearchaeota archaeon]HOK94459.1 redox-regulated ATPase YchF [Candidatus Pacearchaeota archaeon]HPO75515.1 redox-regulated ATPase YchF [Candidatus Pacearchaeota archaeon]
MSLSIGIVGLPNVGKSTLFQTLTKKQVDRANYPFCTIDPNVGVVAVPDERVDKLAELTKSKRKIYATVDFIDIAGLVKGASKGEGLGNQFLANIRETDAIIYVLRAFLNDKIINTQKNIDPLGEKEILDTELILKDLETVEKRLNSLESDIKRGSKEAIKEKEALSKAKKFLEEGKILFEESFTEEELKELKQYQLLTLKPRIYLLNGKDEEVPQIVIDEFKKHNWPYLIIDILTEFETVDLSKEERKELGLPEETELDLLIKKSYEILGLITFLTTGEDETRAWTIKKGTKVPQAGGVIHSDFEKNFIKAEVINWKDLIEVGGFAKAREKGLIRAEGKDYVVQDGDVIEIKHNP